MRRLFSFLFLVLHLIVPATGSAADNSDKLILVSGATGTQGGAVARALLEKGFKVRALTRNPDSDRARVLKDLGMEVVKGDFDDSDSIDAALKGTFGAFSVQQWRISGIEGEIRQGKSFADAAKRAGVKHFVYTGVGVWDTTGIPHFDSKLEIEKHIRGLGISYSILRPTSFMSNYATRSRKDIEAGLMSGPSSPDKTNRYISPVDIGRFAAEAFDNPESWNGRTLEIAGDVKSYKEVAEIFTRIVGHEVRYEQIPWEDFTGSNDAAAIHRVNWFNDVGYRVDVDALRKEFPWLQTLEEYLRATY